MANFFEWIRGMKTQKQILVEILKKLGVDENIVDAFLQIMGENELKILKPILEKVGIVLIPSEYNLDKSIKATEKEIERAVQEIMENPIVDSLKTSGEVGSECYCGVQIDKQGSIMLQRVECITSNEGFQYLKTVQNTIRYNEENQQVEHEEKLGNRRDNTIDGKVFKSDEHHWEESEQVNRTIYTADGKVKISHKKEYSTTSENGLAKQSSHVNELRRDTQFPFIVHFEMSYNEGEVRKGIRLIDFENLADLRIGSTLEFKTVEDAIQYCEEDKSKIIARIMQMPDAKKRADVIAFLKNANLEGWDWGEGLVDRLEPGK